jgi:hypothetical protein
MKKVYINSILSMFLLTININILNMEQATKPITPPAAKRIINIHYPQQSQPRTKRRSISLPPLETIPEDPKERSNFCLEKKVTISTLPLPTKQ